MHITKTRNPYAAATLSLVPGLGHCYYGNPRKGLLLLAAGTINAMLFFASISTRSFARLLSRFLESIGLETNSKFYELVSHLSQGNSLAIVMSILSFSFLVYAVFDAYHQASASGNEDPENSSSFWTRSTKTDSPLVELSSLSYIIHVIVFALLGLSAIIFALPRMPDVPSANLQLILCPEPTPEAEASQSSISSDDHQSLIDSASRSQRQAALQSSAEAIPTHQSNNHDKVSAQVKQSSSMIATPTEKVKASAAQPRRDSVAPAEQQSMTMPPESYPSKLAELNLPDLIPAPEFGTSSAKPLEPADANHSHNDTGRSVPASIALSASQAAAGTDGLIQAQLLANTSQMPGQEYKSTGRTALDELRKDPSFKQPLIQNQNMPFPLQASNYRLPPNIVPTPVRGPGIRSCDLERERIPHETPPLLIDPENESAQNEVTRYLQYLNRRIKRAWFTPHDCTPVCVVLFKINRAGNVNDLHLSRSSGRAMLDQSCLNAVTNAAPFQRLPESFPDSVDIEFRFDQLLISRP